MRRPVFGRITDPKAMGPLLKTGFVLAGYVAASMVASAVVAVRIALTNGPVAQASSGMYAFGDGVVFVAVFGVAALVPTGAALFFLRHYRAVWHVLSALALGIASTGVAALAASAFARNPGEHPILDLWSALAPVRILAAPLPALTFLVAGLFSPHRPSRLALLAAAGAEIFVSGCGGFLLFGALLFP